MNVRPGVLVHGGAGDWRRYGEERRERARKVVAEAAAVGFEALKSGSALDAVVEAVAYMEDSGVLNAGKGSALTLAGTIEMDAGLMDGASRRAGAVAAVSNVRYPIKLARAVMEKTDHILLVGSGAEYLARCLGLETADYVTEEKRERLKKAFNDWISGKAYKWLVKNRDLIKYYVKDTVGAVAVDKDGNVAAATSTGGYWLKLPGRVGDTPIPGAGFWAENGAGAASATGVGEVIMMVHACLRAVEFLKTGMAPKYAAESVVALATSLYGENNIGIIVIDCRGRVGVAMNTAGMARAYMGEGMKEPVAAIMKDEPFKIE